MVTFRQLDNGSENINNEGTIIVISVFEYFITLMCVNKIRTPYLHSEHCYEILERLTSSSGMHNIRPAGQMWSAEASNLVRDAQFFIYFARFFNKNSLCMYKNLALEHLKKIFGPPLDLSWAPLF